MEDIIQETKNVIGSIIRKPKMSDKLLSRPPFRFLHDTIMAIDAKTNFVQELLEDDEKDSSNIKEKEAKIGFLKKIINFAGICNGEEVDVRANKIVAGAEAENTNVLMQVLGRVSQDTTIDFAAAASLAINGESPGNIPRVGGGEGKEADDDQADAAAKRAQEEEAAAEMERQREEEKRRKRKKEKERLQQQKEEEERRARQAEEQQRAAAEEETKSPGSPGGNAAQETKDSDGNIGGGDFDTSSVDGETATTTQLYDGLIRKPKLSDKLLGKPPFRFLHDIVSNVNASVSIVDGLFEGEELDARQCSTKELKLGYLEKLVSFVSICTGTTVQARPSRIVAGHEAEKTNMLLQKLALIARNNGQGAISASEAVQHVLQGTTPSSSASAPSASVVEAEKPKEKSKKQAAREAAQPSASSPRSPEQHASEEKQTEEKEPERKEIEEPVRTATTRPQTARKRPPKIREKAQEVTAKDKTQSRDNTPAVGVMMDGQDDDDSDEDVDVADNPAGSNPASTRRRGENDDNPALDDGELKSKLVRDILDDEGKTSEQKEDKGETKAADPVSSGITMGKIGQGLRRGSKTAATMGVVEVDRIREAIQLLCQSTNPLGKCMDYVHEDLSVMSKELEKWRSDYRKSCDALEDEQRSTSETLLPLRGKLLEVDGEIKDEQAKLATLKSSIAKNDQRIAELLRDMVLN